VARSRQPKLVVRIVAGLLVTLLVGSLLIAAFSGAGSNDAADDAQVEAVDPAAATSASGLPVVTLTELPPEAIETLNLIVTGGPYPYDQDGGVFQNREGILPDRDLGYYTEYTVDTPGSDDRGARRIVVGGDLEAAYYTEDHYDSFREIRGS
jgi:ribonuclease T1